MGFKPRPPPPPSANSGTPGMKKKGVVAKTSKVASPGFLTRKSSISPKRDTVRREGSWWNLNEDGEERPKSSRNVRSSKGSAPPSPSPGRRSSLGGSGSLHTPVNSTRKTVFRHKVFHNGSFLYEWEQNPKFVTIYYPTPNADFKAFCNIAEGHLQLGTKPKKLPTKWFLSHDTGGQVDTEESHWKQHKQHCRIFLAKENKGSTWARALRDSRVDETKTTQMARPTVDRAQSQPAMSPSRSPSSMKHKVSQRRRSNDPDDPDQDLGERRRSSRSSRRSRDSDDPDQDFGERRNIRHGKRRSGSKNTLDSSSDGSDGSDDQDRPMNRGSKSHDGVAVRRKSGSHLRSRSKAKKDAPPRRTKSSCSAPVKPMPAVVFVDPTEEEAELKQKLQRRKSRRKVSSQSRSRSCDSIDEEPPHDIEVDLNSDLVSVLGA